MIDIGKILPTIDKETFIKLTQPDLKLCLTLSIISLPLIVKEYSITQVQSSLASEEFPIYVKIIK